MAYGAPEPAGKRLRSGGRDRPRAPTRPTDGTEKEEATARVASGVLAFAQDDVAGRRAAPERQLWYAVSPCEVMSRPSRSSSSLTRKPIVTSTSL